MEELKAGIAAALKASTSALAALEAALVMAEAGPEAVVEHLMNELFATGASILLKARNSLAKSRDAAGVAAIRTVSSYLIPWLYVVTKQISTAPFEPLALGDVLALPAGMTTFAEIVMAGINRRAAAFPAGAGPWPSGKWALSLRAFPEGGRGNTFEDSPEEAAVDPGGDTPGDPRGEIGCVDRITTRPSYWR